MINLHDAGQWCYSYIVDRNMAHCVSAQSLLIVIINNSHLITACAQSADIVCVYTGGYSWMVSGWATSLYQYTVKQESLAA